MEADFLLFLQEFIRNDILNPIMIVITHTGDYGILFIGAALILVLAPTTRRLGHLVTFSLIIESVVVNMIIKNWVARTRPYDAIEELERLIGEQVDYSFPSGHTGVAFAFAGAMLFALLYGIKGLTESRKYKVITLFVLLYAVVLAFSRMYVGVHYPSDVLAGMFIGIVSGCISFHLEKLLSKAWEKRH